MTTKPMPGRVMWLDPSEERVNTNPFLKYFRIVEDCNGSPSADFYQPVRILTDAELLAYIEQREKLAFEAGVNSYEDEFKMYDFDRWKKQQEGGEKE